jgi:hypothetical protein
MVIVQWPSSFGEKLGELRRCTENSQFPTCRNPFWADHHSAASSLAFARVGPVNVFLFMAVLCDPAVGYRSRRPIVHTHGTVRAAILQAFDLLELNGEDLRPVMLGKRKARLARLLARAPPGIELNEHIDEDGAAVFRHSCVMGLEGIVSKRLSAP